MDESVLDCYIRAGKIASLVREKSKKWVIEGEKLLSVAEKIESEIISCGGQLAFPVNISLNEIAAHYTPVDGDAKTFSKEDIIKVDIGVHIDGYIADTASSVYLGGDKRKISLVKAADSALENAISAIKPGVSIQEISRAIEDTIRKSGFFPITNLTGHYLEKYSIHASPSIPNVRTESKAVLAEGDVIAIEPFATDGSGEVKDAGRPMIFSFVRGVSPRSAGARKIQAFAKNLNSLPFASRWIKEPKGSLRESGLRELVSLGGLYPYPPLKEVAGGRISQAEHTVIVGEKPLVITR